MVRWYERCIKKNDIRSMTNRKKCMTRYIIVVEAKEVCTIKKRYLLGN